MDKENSHGSRTGTQTPRPARQRVPTEKVSTKRAEEAAIAKRREDSKARKVDRARHAQENGDDNAGKEGQRDGAKSVPSSNFKTHTVTSKAVTLKTKALAKRDNLPAPAARGQAASTREAQTHVKKRTVASDSVNLKTKALAKRDHLPARGQAASTREETPQEDIPDEDEQDKDEQDDNQPNEDEPNEDEQDDNQPDEDEQDDNQPDEDEQEEDREPSPEFEDPGSYSTASVAGLKRTRSLTESLKETKMLRTSSGRPKAADYDDLLKAVIVSAISYYRANLSCSYAFPDIATEAEMLTQVWKFTCTQLDTKASITPQIAKLITSRGSQLRGELKSKTRPLVEGCFGFESGMNKKIIAKNRQTAENLKEGKGFIPDSDAGQRKGMYQAKIIQNVVNVMWFCNKQDEGVVHQETFNPLSMQALALVLAAIECCIDEWISGIRSDVPFSTALYKDVYEDHIRCLQRFHKITKEMILPQILVKLYNRGRFHAGAVPISTASVPTICDAAFEAALKEYEEDSNTETDGENGDSD